MATRTSKALVEGIIETDAAIIPDDAALVPFQDIANEMVTEWCTGTVNGPATAYDATRLALIETWLCAHFYTNRDPRAHSEKAGSVGANLQNKIDLGFDSSFYGQTAMRLDTNGGLATLNNRSKKGSGKVAAVWLGTSLD